MVDDGSTDHSPAICDEFAEQDERIKVIHKRNGGLSDARNAGLDVATGEYIGFVDGDDWVDEDMYETLYHLIYEHQADISICTHYTELPNRTKVKYKSKKTKIFSSQKAIATLIEDKIIQNYIWEKLFKRELFTELRFPVGWSFEDIALCYKIFHKARKIVLLQTPKYHYRTRPGSITNSTRNPLKEFQYLQALHEQFQFAAENNIKVRKPKKLVQKTFHFINHIIILPPSSLKKKYINDAFEIHSTPVSNFFADRYKKNVSSGLGCNMSFWRSDFLAINGYDEFFEGWGKEDDDLTHRLQRKGCKKRSLRFAGIVYHLWHGHESMESDQKNAEYFRKNNEKNIVYCENGVSKYLKQE